MFYTMLNTMIMLALVIALGYYLQRKDVLSDDVRTKLTYILLDICMPAVFFMSLQIEATDELLASAKSMILATFAMHFFFLAVSFVFSKLIKATDDEKGIIIFSSTFKNLTYIGLPLVVSLFPDNNPAFYVTLYCIPFNVLAFSLGPKLLSNDKNTKIRLKDFTNKVNIATLLGLIFFFCNITVPRPIGDAIDTISQLTIPLSLLLTGALLTKANFKTIIKEPKVMIVSFFNLIILPLLFLGLLRVANFDDFTVSYSFIMSMLPAATLTILLTDRFKGNIDFAVKIIMTTTLFSLITTVLLVSFI